MHEAKYAFVFWTLSKTPFTAVLSLHVSSSGNCLLAEKFVDTIRSTSSLPNRDAKQSSIILISLLNSRLWLSLEVPMQPAECIWDRGAKQLLCSWGLSPCKNELIFFSLFACLFEMYYAVPQKCREKWGYGSTSTEEQTALSSSFSACLLSVVLSLIARVLLKQCGVSVCYL